MYYTPVGFFKDDFLNKQYTLVRATASQVSLYLKNTFEELGLDYNRFNMHEDMGGDEKSPPTEIYEYQNFFLMKRKAGNYILLDGFRRLLYSTAPDHTIYLRIYQEEDFSREDIMRLMVYLNHFKFYGISKYYDRGFALVMFLLFGLDVPKMRSMFDAYLRGEDDKSFYNSTTKSSDSYAVKDVSTRLTDPLFVDSMLFLQNIVGTNQMVNKYFALQFRAFMEKYQKPLLVEEFLLKITNNKQLPDLLEKYKKVGAVNSSDSTKVVRQITEIYQVAFDELLGVEVVKPYVEVLHDMKQMSLKLRKDKSLKRLSKMQNISSFTKELVEKHEKGEKIEFKMVVYPYDELTYKRGDNNQPAATPGLYENLRLKYKPATNNYGSRAEMQVELVTGGKVQGVVRPGYSTWRVSKQNYITLEPVDTFFKKVSDRVVSVMIDLYVKI